MNSILDTSKSALSQLEAEGCLIIENVFEKSLVGRLKDDLIKASKACFQIQSNQGVGRSIGSDENALGADGALGGAAHHVVCYGGSFLELLETKPCFDLISEYLGGLFILNSFGAVTNTKTNNMYEHAMLVHRDSRSFHPSFRQTLWMLVMLDDFTEANGATHLLAGSHCQENKPSDEVFFSNSMRAIGGAGSVAIYDGRLWHACGKNTTDQPRRALTLSFSLPFIKPQMDYVRSFGTEAVNKMSNNLKQLLGYYSRVPSNYEEWYLKPEERFYQSNQG